MNILNGKVAIITGAASGIGKATALLFAKEGAKVVVSDISEKGNDTVSEIKKAGGEAIFIKADTSKVEENEKLVQQTVAQYGALHIAFNNAGVASPPKDTTAFSVEEWNKVIGINLSGVFFGLKYQIPAIIAAGGGSIINTASIMGAVAQLNQVAYNTSKHGVIGLTKSAALEFSSKKVRINAVGPGFINTPILDFLSEDEKNLLIEKHPIGRLGEAEEVAEIVLWLASDKASFATGTYYPIDGGYLAQ